MIQIDKQLIQQLFDQAVVNHRLRQSYDLRNGATDIELRHKDNSQRRLNALMPGTKVPTHRHPNSNETALCLCGKLVEVLYEVDSKCPPTGPLGADMPLGMDAHDVPNGVRLKESARFMLDPSVGNFGCVVPAGAWHTVEVLEPSVIYEAKDGKYGEDGSEAFDEYKAKIAQDSSQAPFSNSIGDLRKNIEYLIGMERQSGSMEVISPLYVSRMLNVPFEEIEKCMNEMGV